MADSPNSTDTAFITGLRQFKNFGKVKLEHTRGGWTGLTFAR